MGLDLEYFRGRFDISLSLPVTIRVIVPFQLHRDRSFKLSVNLSNLPVEEKNIIELEKQASFLVWQIRESKAMPEQIENQANKISDSRERETFLDFIAKYKQMMNVT